MVAVDITVLSNAIMVLLLSALGTMFWARLNRLERRIDEFDRTLRAEFKQEIGLLRQEQRQDFASLRSDLTQVALAVGVRPRLVEE